MPSQIIDTLQKFINKPGRKGAFIVGAVLGLLFFLTFYGVYVIVPTHVNWLFMGAPDLKQHYSGWVFYRRSPWAFPLGVAKELAYPFGLPITYTDSIPLLAIPFKVIAGILPQNFQYLGLWGVICYALQGGFGALIIRRWTKSIVLIMLGAAFFILSPVLLARMFLHTALASQWIVLAGIWALLECKTTTSLKRQIIIWSVLLGLAPLIHPYFIPMISALLFMSVARTHTSWRDTALKLAIPITLSMIAFWAIGGFYVSDAAGGVLGTYAYNLDSLYNPLGYSRFFSNIPNVSPSFETVNYLGAGMLALLPVALYLALTKIGSFGHLKRMMQKLTVRQYVIAGIVLGLLILALSPEVQFGNRILLSYPIPVHVAKLWETFRSSGRLFWPIYYLLMVGILASVIKFNKKLSTAMLCALIGAMLFAQFVDIRFSEAARLKHGELFYASSHDMYVSSLDTAQMQKLAKNKKHLIALGKFDTNQYMGLIDVALQNHLTMTDGYYARKPKVKILAYDTKQRKDILSGHADVNDLYITDDTAFVSSVESKSNYKAIKIDNFYVIQ